MQNARRRAVTRSAFINQKIRTGEKTDYNLKFVLSVTQSQMKADIAMCFLILLLRIQDIWGSIPGQEDCNPLEVCPSVLGSTRQALLQYILLNMLWSAPSCFLTHRYVNPHPSFHATK